MTTTLPTYSDTIPAILQWAVARELLHPDGSANLATAFGQHAKTVEEIGEAIKALGALNAAREAGCITDENDALALELGDVLITLCIQSSIQGVGFEYCRARAGEAYFRASWPFIAIHMGGLGSAIRRYSQRTPAYIGAVALCVEEIARVELSLLGPEVMALALARAPDGLPPPPPGFPGRLLVGG